MRTVSGLMATAAIIGGCYGSISAQQYLTGEISGSYPAGEYDISGNMHVVPGKTLSFAAGSVLRFENFTGIIVRGALSCKGTSAQPVVFTSVNDVTHSRTAAEAFDWNGIKVTAEASGVSLENCTIAYSTFGIDIESNKTPVSVKNVSFRHNGTASFTREKKMVQVQENQPVSFTWPETVKPNSPANRSSSTPTVSATGHKKPGWIKSVRITGAGVAVAGAGLWLTGHLQAEHYNTLYWEPGISLANANSYKNSRDGWVTVRNIGIGIFGLGAAGFALTFVF